MDSICCALSITFHLFELDRMGKAKSENLSKKL